MIYQCATYLIFQQICLMFMVLFSLGVLVNYSLFNITEKISLITEVLSPLSLLLLLP